MSINNSTGGVAVKRPARKKHHGLNVQLCRRIRGVKQPELAAYLGISLRTLTRMESRAVIPDETLIPIAQYLNFDIEFMKELTEDSQLKVINVHEGGKNYEPSSTDSSTIIKDNGKNFEPNARSFEANAKNFEPHSISEGAKNFTDNSQEIEKIETANYGVPIEKYEEVYKMVIARDKKIAELEKKILKLEFQLQNKQ